MCFCRRRVFGMEKRPEKTSKTHAKSLPGSTRSTQNCSREAPGAPKIDAKSLPGRSQAPKGPPELVGGRPGGSRRRQRVDFWRFWGSGREPKIDQKRVRERKSASGDVAGSVFCRFFLPLPFGVALRTDFSSIFHRKSRLNRGSFFTQAPDFFRRGDLKDSV